MMMAQRKPQHKLVYRYTRNSEFCGCDTTHTEYFDSWEAANARVFELLSGHTNEYDSSILTINWYDYACDVEPLYRHFEVRVPDRG